MKTVVIMISVLALGVFTGCGGPAKEKQFFTVDFHKDQTLRYKFVSTRDITIDWSYKENRGENEKTKIDKSSESMEMVIAYSPVEVDPYGLTTIKATCESVTAKRSSGRGTRGARSAKPDAVESLAGKAFTFSIDPAGKIVDYSELDRLIRQAGQKTFRQSRKGRIKDPDMVGDFIVSQWFLWNSISSIENGAAGVSVGQSWKSHLSVPNPVLLRKARDVTYTFAEIQQSEKGQVAVIRSTFSLAESARPDWPAPYGGKFSLAGPFGFLLMFGHGFQLLDLQGQGEELFNIDSGRIERYEHNYTMNLSTIARSVLPGLNPRVTIEQNLTMQLIND